MITKVGLSAGRSQGCAKRQGGFTLIELSIVLTIIGLIVGGVLKGQELIANARIKAQMAQIDRIKSGVLTFQDRYAYLPGDDPNIGALLSGGAPGDGNGAIAATTATSVNDNTTVIGTESPLAWAQLSAANLLAGYVVPTSVGPLASVTAATNLANVPGKITGSYLWLATFSDNVNPQVNLAVRLQNEALGVSPNTGIRVADMQGIDNKYDDGLPFTGSIWIAWAGQAGTCVSAGAVTGTYATVVANPAALPCIPMFGVQ